MKEKPCLFSLCCILFVAMAQWPDAEPDPDEVKLKKDLKFKGDSNFLDWQFDIITVLKGAKLNHHLLMDDSVNPAGADDVLIRRVDNRRAVYTYIYHNLEGKPKRIVRGAKFDGKPKLLMDTLKVEYHIPSTVTINDLETELDQFRMKTSETLFAVKGRLEILEEKLLEHEIQIDDHRKRSILVKALVNEDRV